MNKVKKRILAEWFIYEIIAPKQKRTVWHLLLYLIKDLFGQKHISDDKPRLYIPKKCRDCNKI